MPNPSPQSPPGQFQRTPEMLEAVRKNVERWTRDVGSTGSSAKVILEEGEAQTYIDALWPLLQAELRRLLHEPPATCYGYDPQGWNLALLQDWLCGPVDGGE